MFDADEGVDRLMGIGEDPESGGAVYIDPLKLNRHTFWCGQSGSGKTYSLGVLLEEVIMRTRLPLVVLDPNSDFAYLNVIRDDAVPLTAKSLRGRDIRVFGKREGQGQLRVNFLGMPITSRAAVMQISPTLDAEEFNVMLQVERLIREKPLESKEWTTDRLRQSDDSARRKLATRIENLLVLESDIWAAGRSSVVDVLAQMHDASIFDLGSLDSLSNQKIAALSILDYLWENRADRTPRLVVIDEAHNFCTPSPANDVDQVLSDRIAQIAAEGRKFGIWLVLSTQRPSKLPANVVSQCDNLALMRMNSSRDVDDLVSLFSFVPEPLIRRALDFEKGVGLFAGGFVKQATMVSVRKRLTSEGGADIQVPLR